MTLNITVGLLSDIDEEDEEMVHEELHFLEEVNQALRERGLPEHHEPAEPPAGFQGWNASLDSADLEELLGLAVTLCNSDPETATQRFPHLVGTQCSYYLPIDVPEPLVFEIDEEDDEGENYDMEFESEADDDDEQDDESALAEDDEQDVLFGDEEEDEDYLIGVGSSLKLKHELEEIARAIDLPVDSFPVDYSGEGGSEQWQGILSELREKKARCAEVENATRALVNLMHACQLSEQYKLAVCLG
mgnify:CR=1 FL=1